VRLQQLLLQAAAEERVVLQLYALLCDRYDGTALAAMRPEQFDAYRGLAPPTGHALQPTAHALPEVVELRARRRRLLVADDAPCDRPSVLFVRSREQFVDQLDAATADHPPSGEVVCYRGCLSTFLAADDEEPLPIHALWSGAPPGPPVLRRLIGDQELIAVWGSAFLRWSALADALTYRAKGYWLICDVPPPALLRATRALIPEMWGQWRAPLRERPNVGALVVIQVGEAGPVDGIVFPGSRTIVSSLVVTALRQELGDDLRGIGAGPAFGRQHGQFSEGTFLTEWLVRTEHSFRFRDLGRN
jgi:hypothetical protein